MTWTPNERPGYVKKLAYDLARPFGPFDSILEVGTKEKDARTLLREGGRLATTDEPVLGMFDPDLGEHELVVALHVLEHIELCGRAALQLWAASTKYLLVEVPALEVELPSQEFDDVNPGHVHHFDMATLLHVFGGRVMAIEAVRTGGWPCNRVLLRKDIITLEDKKRKADEIYSDAAKVVADIVSRLGPRGVYYFGDGYSHKRLIAAGAPVLDVFDSYKGKKTLPVKGSFIITPRYGPTRREIALMLKARSIVCVDPWLYLETGYR